MLLIGPFWVFSEYGGFTAPNPAEGGKLELSFVVNKNMSMSELMDESYEAQAAQDETTAEEPAAEEVTPEDEEATAENAI